MDTAGPYKLTLGESPLLVSMPHVGTELPADLAGGWSEHAPLLTDTDWHVDRLYNFLGGMKVSVISARYSRYVIDLNRRTDGVSLYPGLAVTEICPTTDFSGQPLYLEGQEPGATEIGRRVEAYWQPYHRAVQNELTRIKNRFGYALLWDAHSIRSEVPLFFEGKLPDLNFGTGNGSSCSPDFIDTLQAAAKNLPGFSHVVNGRFKGGAITREYGQPSLGVHAVQLELSQATYMDELPPFTFREDLALNIRPVLRSLIDAALNWTP